MDELIRTRKEVLTMLPARRIPVVVASVALLVTALTGCARNEQAGSQPSAPAPATSAPASPAPSSTPAAPPTTPAPTGLVWPIGVRSLAALPSAPAQPAVLKTISTGRHGSYERLVLTFTGAYQAVTVKYVPVVRADPSDAAVTLAGRAYLQITVHGAVARWGEPAHPYAGPTTVTPGYPTLRQARISGDFEAVLSLGVGVSRTAGFQVMRLRSPDRLVIDVATAPNWRMWPDDNLTQARAVQAAYELGHQSWRGEAKAVLSSYALSVYGWSAPVITATGHNTYRLALTGSPDAVTVQVVWPFATTAAHGICEVANTR
jgi:hypothetical protein